MKPSKLIFKMFLFAILFLGVAPQVTSAAIANFDLTGGTWHVSGIDNGGTTWGGSSLIFETQTLQGQDYSLTGHFNWIGSGGQSGRENFTGTLFSDRSLQLSGFELVPPSIGIGLANYFATLGVSGREIINGSWDGAAVTPSSNWSATLAPVPLPAAAWLFGAGVIGLAGLARRKMSIS